MRPQVFLLVLLLVSSASAGRKKGYGTMYRVADQKVEIAGEAKRLGVANRKCENYAWAAIVEAMMRAQKVNIPQDDWAVKTSDGMKCFPSLNDYPERAAALNGDYSLDGGRSVRIAAVFAPGTPDPDTMIYELKSGRPLMVVWNGRPYLLYGLLYDEMRHSSGASKQYIIREMKLLDAAVVSEKPERMISITKDAGQLDQVTGYMQVTVTPREWYELAK